MDLLTQSLNGIFSGENMKASLEHSRKNRCSTTTVKSNKGIHPLEQ